ncbi:hypothetical protein EJ04DRAFT_467535 [Polyplosphaeria fusca]|uniref:ABM domain-containing protein n=1 Tax=Polyplosphaeria fusca TaxID=682080 RepID=A0A9P4QUD6_9PLEO|nr:hypothetical protein EJ04DRAFT_467535 [Polyplosphaeria fusca]
MPDTYEFDRTKPFVPPTTTDGQIHIIAIGTPVAGKEHIVESAMARVAEHAREHEPGTLVYSIHKELKTDGSVAEYVAVETYADTAAFEAHQKSVPFVEEQQRAIKENVWAGPLKVYFTKPIAGYKGR